MAKNESILQIVDILNEWGLVLIGLGLFAGLLSKPAKLCGVALLAFYYLAYPPFASLGVNAHAEGSYWVVNKNLIEMVALFVLFMFPSSHITGIDRFIFKKEKKK
jgi:thiosulfate dehydrogenase [quinone] large subunit